MKIRRYISGEIHNERGRDLHRTREHKEVWTQELRGSLWNYMNEKKNETKDIGHSW